jgi:hypothetical protein
MTITKRPPADRRLLRQRVEAVDRLRPPGILDIIIQIAAQYAIQTSGSVHHV